MTWEEQVSAYVSGHKAGMGGGPGSPGTYEQWLSRYLVPGGGQAWPTTPPQPIKVRYQLPPPGPPKT